MLEIIPSILTNEVKEFNKLLDKLTSIALPKYDFLGRVQIDINDGTFLGVKTVEPQLLSELKSNLKFDYHLMVSDPTSWIRRCVHADRIIGQIEHMDNQSDFINEVKKWGLKVGFAVDYATNLDELNSDDLEILDVILLMAYPAGMGGQDFKEEVFNKIEKLKDLRSSRGCNFRICLDGGIDSDNIKRVKLAGADEVVIGKRITEGNIEENFEKFYKASH